MDEGSLGLDSRPGGGGILDGHPVPPREKGLYLPAMCRGQTQVDAPWAGVASYLHKRNYNTSLVMYNHENWVQAP